MEEPKEDSQSLEQINLFSITNNQESEKSIVEEGQEIEIDNRLFIVNKIKDNEVELIDKTFNNTVGFPIFRHEPISFIEEILKERTIESELEETIDDEGLLNYKYNPEDEIGIGGLKTKFRNNIEAIKTLKTIETENRLATKEEQKILAKYVGWGGGMSQAFDKIIVYGTGNILN